MQALSLSFACVALLATVLVASEHKGTVELQSRFGDAFTQLVTPAQRAAATSQLEEPAAADAEAAPPAEEPAAAPAADPAPAADAAAAPADAAAAPADAAAAPAAGGAAVVTFPGDYPNSVKHFLLIGWAMFGIGAGVLFYIGTWALPAEKRTSLHPVAFLVCASCALAYYAMYVGLGVEFQAAAAPPRVVFPARYLVHLVAVPTLLLNLSLFAQTDLTTTILMVGCDVLAFATLGMMGVVTTPQRYLWWMASALFFCAVVPSLLTLLSNAEAQKQPKLKPIIWVIVLSHVAILATSLAGGEGTGALGLTQEVGVMTAVDLIVVLTTNFWLVISQNSEGTVWA